MVEPTNMDEEIRKFLDSERRAFEERSRDKSPNPREEIKRKRKGKEKAENTETRYKSLKEA